MKRLVPAATIHRSVSIVLVSVCALAGAAGCRSLVEPDAELRPPLERSIDGRITERNAVPIGIFQVNLSNSAYASASPYVRSVAVSPSGVFSIPVPRDFDGYFDLDVYFEGVMRPATHLYLGLRDTGEPLRLELEMSRVLGRIEAPPEITGLEFPSNGLRFRRSDPRPDPYGNALRTIYPVISASGEVDDYVPAGEWEAIASCSGCGPFEALSMVIWESYSGGSLSTVLPLRRFTLTPRMPAGWSGPIPVVMKVERESVHRAEQPVEIGSGDVELWGPEALVAVRVDWPATVGALYTAVTPANRNGRVDLSKTQSVELILPPHVVRIRVVDDQAVVSDATVLVSRPYAYSTLKTDADGQVAYFTASGRLDIEVNHAMRTRELWIPVTGDTELVIDLADAATRPID